MLWLLAEREGRRWRMLPWADAACGCLLSTVLHGNTMGGTPVVSFGCKLLKSDSQAQALLCSFLCCLFGCGKVYDGKPIEKYASDKRKLVSLHLDNFDVHSSHSPWFFLSCASQLVSPAVWGDPCRQKPGRDFSFPLNLDISDPTAKTLASACSTFVSRGKKLHFPPQDLTLDPVRWTKQSWIASCLP